LIRVAASTCPTRFCNMDADYGGQYVRVTKQILRRVNVVVRL